LTDVKKIHRFMFAADKVKAVQNGVRGHAPTFDGQYNKVHIDENWFFLSRMERSISWWTEKNLPSEQLSTRSTWTR
jgi:hypothetical protein